MRDPLRELPVPPPPERLLGSSGRTRARWRASNELHHRVTCAANALKNLFIGDLKGVSEMNGPEGSVAEWRLAHALPKAVMERVLERHRWAQEMGVYDLCPTLAFGRLGLQVDSADDALGETIPMLKQKEPAMPVMTTPVKGKVLPWTYGVIALPPEGSKACNVVDFSPRANYHFTYFNETMLKPAHEIDWQDVAATRTFSDASLRSRKKRIRSPP